MGGMSARRKQCSRRWRLPEGHVTYIDEMEPDVIVIGAGVAGLYQLHRLRGLGLRVAALRSRHRCRRHLVLEPLSRGALQIRRAGPTAIPSPRSSCRSGNGPSISPPNPTRCAYLNYVADKFDLRRDIRFGCRVVAARFDEAGDRWSDQAGERRAGRARLLITALGSRSRPTRCPTFPVCESFTGAGLPHLALAARGRVGSPASASASSAPGRRPSRSSQTIAAEVGHLTVFQRTPNWAAPLHNRRITPRGARRRSRRPRTRSSSAAGRPAPASSTRPIRARPWKFSAEEREAFWEKLYGEPGFGIWVGNFADVLTDREGQRARQRLHGQEDPRAGAAIPKVADKLIPKDHGFGTRRLPLETRLFRGLQPGQRAAGRHQRDADRAHHAAAASGPAPRISPSTS